MVLPGMGLEPMACLVGGLSSNTLGWVARYDAAVVCQQNMQSARIFCVMYTFL